MEASHNLAAVETELPGRSDGGDSRRDVAVVFTGLKPTVGALREAARMGAQVILVVPQTVPFPLPLSEPPVLLPFSEGRLRGLACESGVEVSIRLYLCRKREDGLRVALRPRSMVVIGTRKRWWSTAERRLAAHLRRAGHQVVVVQTQ